MNGIDEINKKRLYYEGLKQAIALPLPEELGHDLEEIFQDEETNEAIKETIRFWKEVEGPFVNAIAFIYNNRFIIEEKDALIKTDDETPFMMPDEFFNILKTLLKATVTEFLSVLHVPSNKKAKLLECVEHNDKAGFVSVMEHADCDTTALAKLCALCKDNASTGFEMKDDDFTYYLDYMASHLHEEDGADNRKMIEALKCWQPSAELLDDDDSDEALNRYFSDYRHFLETDLATNLHYYWDWHGDFTLKERNLIDPILDNPLAKNLIAAIREEYENPKPQPTEPIVGMQQTPQIEEHQTSRSPAEVVEQKNAEKGITQNKDEKLFADKWPLPDDFFEPAYIDDGCPQDEYFPEFLKDLVQFEGQNEQLDDQYAELRKKDLETLSVKFREFINELASKNYIPNDDANKLVLAHALTGRRVSPR